MSVFSGDCQFQLEVVSQELRQPGFDLFRFGLWSDEPEQVVVGLCRACGYAAWWRCSAGQRGSWCHWSGHCRRRACGFHRRSSKTRVQDQCRDIAVEDEWPVHLCLDAVVYVLALIGLSQLYERHGGRDTEGRRFEDAVWVAERGSWEDLSSQPKARGAEPGAPPSRQRRKSSAP
jgi:hypothetical protein